MSNVASARWFVPEAITHLYYSPVYATLSPGQKLIYNKLHACYLCELFVYFEQTLPAYYLKAAARPGVPESLREGVRALHSAEQRHAEMFRKLARHLSPELYSEFRFHFIRLPRAASALLRAACGRPSLFPAMFWIVLMQEERAIFYANEILREASRLDPQTVEVQRRHKADESAHLGVDEALLSLYWDANRPWVRRLNGILLRLLVSEFLVAPKRGGVRLVDRWVTECRELRPRRAELAAAMRRLAGEPRFHESLYSRRIVPRTFALFDRYVEFRGLGKSLWAYSPEAAS